MMSNVVAEHFRIAEFLWSQFERALDAPDYTLDEWANRDEDRLFANIDGLRVAGPDAQQHLLLPALAEATGDRLALAAFVLLPTHEAEVVTALGAADPARARPIARALELHDPMPASLLDVMHGLCGAKQPAWVRKEALDVLTAHGVPSREPLSVLKAASEPELVAAALRSLRLDLAESHRSLLSDAIASDDPAVRTEGLVSGAVLGMEAAWKRCRQLVSDRDPTSGLAVAVLAIVGDQYDERALDAALETPGLREMTMVALGFGGRRHGVDAALRYIDDATLARLAGEAFVAITGMPVTRVAAPKDGVVLADVSATPEEALPLLDPEAVRCWWADHGDQFQDQERYVAGQPHSRATMITQLRHGPMRRRHAWALGLSLRSGGRERVATRAFSMRQYRDLAALSS